MQNHVIALGRQFGSGGREIGRRLSQSLGFAYYDRELISLAAQRAQVREELFVDKMEDAERKLELTRYLRQEQNLNRMKVKNREEILYGSGKGNESA